TLRRDAVHHVQQQHALRRAAARRQRDSGRERVHTPAQDVFGGRIVERPRQHRLAHRLINRNVHASPFHSRSTQGVRAPAETALPGDGPSPTRSAPWAYPWAFVMAAVSLRRRPPKSPFDIMTTTSPGL